MNPQQSQVLQLLAYTYLCSARAPKAAALLAALDALAPGQRRVMRSLAYAQVLCGQHGPALQTLERVAQAGGIDVAYHLLRARALAACGRRIEASAAMAACQVIRAALVPPGEET